MKKPRSGRQQMMPKTLKDLKARKDLKTRKDQKARKNLNPRMMLDLKKNLNPGVILKPRATLNPGVTLNPMVRGALVAHHLTSSHSWSTKSTPSRTTSKLTPCPKLPPKSANSPILSPSWTPVLQTLSRALTLRGYAPSSSMILWCCLETPPWTTQSQSQSPKIREREPNNQVNSFLPSRTPVSTRPSSKS